MPHAHCAASSYSNAAADWVDRVTNKDSCRHATAAAVVTAFADAEDDSQSTVGTSSVHEGVVFAQSRHDANNGVKRYHVVPVDTTGSALPGCVVLMPRGHEYAYVCRSRTGRCTSKKDGGLVQGCCHTAAMHKIEAVVTAAGHDSAAVAAGVAGDGVAGDSEDDADDYAAESQSVERTLPTWVNEPYAKKFDRFEKLETSENPSVALDATECRDKVRSVV